MTAHNRKLTQLTLDLGGTEFQIQCRKAEIVNNTDDPELFHTFDPDGSFAEAADPSFALDLEFYSDLRSGGITDFLWDNDGNTVSFEIVHYPHIPAETVTFTGEVLVKAPNIGGEVRATDVTATVLQCVDKPVKSRP
jgi:hypothetical protein